MNSAPCLYFVQRVRPIYYIIKRTSSHKAKKYVSFVFLTTIFMIAPAFITQSESEACFFTSAVFESVKFNFSRLACCENVCTYADNQDGRGGLRT